MSPAKLAVGIGWIVSACGFLIAPESTASGILRIVFWFMVVAHAVECAVFLPRLRGAPGGLGGHLLQTFVFGVAHVRELPESGGASAG